MPAIICAAVVQYGMLAALCPKKLNRLFHWMRYVGMLAAAIVECCGCSICLRQKGKYFKIVASQNRTH